MLNPDLAPNAQTVSAINGATYGPTFPNKIANNSPIFAASPNLSIVSPNFRFPYILQASLQIETQIAPDTTLGFGLCGPTASISLPAVPTNTTPNAINDTAFNQATSNSALGINGAAPVPGEGINSFYGPWTEQVDLGFARTFHISERNAVTLQAQAFNIVNHANYYVQNGTGVNQRQYAPSGDNCGDGETLNQTCYLIPETGPGGLVPFDPSMRCMGRESCSSRSNISFKELSALDATVSSEM